MNPTQTLQLLVEHKPVLAERFGVSRLALFGSVVREAAKEGRALSYKLGFPPVYPAASEANKAAYSFVLRVTDAGDLGLLSELWLQRLESTE